MNSVIPPSLIVWWAITLFRTNNRFKDTLFRTNNWFKGTLFRTNNWFKGTLFRTNNRFKGTLFRTNNRFKGTLFRTNQPLFILWGSLSLTPCRYGYAEVWREVSAVQFLLVISEVQTYWTRFPTLVLETALYQLPLSTILRKVIASNGWGDDFYFVQTMSPIMAIGRSVNQFQ